MMPSGVKVYLASQPVDFRKGPDSLLSLVRDAGSDPFSGALYVFRAKRADPRTHRQPMAERQNRRPHALELHALNGISFPLTPYLAGAVSILPTFFSPASSFRSGAGGAGVG